MAQTVQNSGLFGIWIKRDTTFGLADEMSGQDKLERLDRKFLSAIKSQVKISAISENKSTRWTSEAKSEHIEKLAHLNVPNEYKNRCKPMKHFQSIYKLTCKKAVNQ